MTSLMNNNISNMDNDMASNISSLNNMANLAKDIENGIEGMQNLNMNTNNTNNNNYNSTQPNMQKIQELQRLQELQQLQQYQQMQQNSMNQMQVQQQQIPTQQQYNDMQNYNMIPSPVSESKKSSVLNYVSDNFREPIMIAVVFVILNHPALLNALGKYIPHLEVGEVDYSMFNLVLRGLFMGVIIVLLNKTVLK